MMIVMMTMTTKLVMIIVVLTMMAHYELDTDAGAMVATHDDLEHECSRKMREDDGGVMPRITTTAAAVMALER